MNNFYIEKSIVVNIDTSDSCEINAVIEAASENIIQLDIEDGSFRDSYEGDYTITPSSSSQELICKNKLMSQNVEVLAIPFSSVSNESGGRTISIG